MKFTRASVLVEIATLLGLELVGSRASLVGKVTGRQLGVDLDARVVGDHILGYRDAVDDLDALAGDGLEFHVELDLRLSIRTCSRS